MSGTQGLSGAGVERKPCDPWTHRLVGSPLAFSLPLSVRLAAPSSAYSHSNDFCVMNLGTFRPLLVMNSRGVGGGWMRHDFDHHLGCSEILMRNNALDVGLLRENNVTRRSKQG